MVSVWTLSTPSSSSSRSGLMLYRFHDMVHHYQYLTTCTTAFGRQLATVCCVVSPVL